MRSLAATETGLVSGGEDRDVWDRDALGTTLLSAVESGAMPAATYGEILASCFDGGPMCASYLLDRVIDYAKQVLQTLSDGSPTPIWHNEMEPREGGA